MESKRIRISSGIELVFDPKRHPIISITSGDDRWHVYLKDGLIFVSYGTLAPVRHQQHSEAAE